MVRALAQWRGTGHAPVTIFQPAAAAPGFLERMLKDELLVEMGLQTKHLLVSPEGIALLARLSRACEDLDFPARLARWNADWPASEPDVLGYVRAFVSKQRGFVPDR